MRFVAFHLSIHSIREDEMVCHFYAVGLHWVGGTVVEVAYVGLVEVGDALFVGCAAACCDGCCCRHDDAKWLCVSGGRK